jgi:transcriptional regulator GlxA family with amidase domain
MLRNVAVLALDEIAPFELGVVCEVFGVDRTEEGVPSFDFAVVAGDPPPLRTTMGFTVDTPYRLDRLESADLIAVPASRSDREPPEEALEALRTAVDRGARVLSVCTGAFVLGAAGLLDGRRCTTHWRHVEELGQMYPLADLQPDVLYVEDGPIVTSAGTAAGIDACLHIVRQEFGQAVVNTIARRMVVPPHRDGGQAQYVLEPVPECDSESLAPVLTWMLENIQIDVTVEELAGRAVMSPRTFARRFRAETGTTPYAWLLSQRVAKAQNLLESGDEPIERIADLCGFGSASVMRHHFVRARATTPQAYRRTFRRTG